MKGFDQNYWIENYSQPNTMDCIGNAQDHARYLKAFFQLEKVDVSSIIDLGAGYGHLFQKVLKSFLPYKAAAVESSKYAFDKLSKKKLAPVDSTEVVLYFETIEDWCLRSNTGKNRYDLALCTSVFQYLDEETLKTVVENISQKIKYIYLTVPTDKELKKQREDLDFNDRYALKRSRSFYKKVLSKHFTNISSKIWESKYYFNEETTLFSDLLYRS